MWEWRDGPPIEGQERTRGLFLVSQALSVYCFSPARKRTVDLENELGIETNEVSNLGTGGRRRGYILHSYIPSLAEIEDWIPDPCGFPDKNNPTSARDWRNLKSFRSLFDELRD